MFLSYMTLRKGLSISVSIQRERVQGDKAQATERNNVLDKYYAKRT